MKCGTISPGRYDPAISNELKAPPVVPDFGPDETLSQGEVFDRLSYETMELGHLKDLLDKCRLDLGRISLQRAIAHPPEKSNDTRARQAALAELSAKPDMVKSLDQLLDETSRDEKGLFELSWHNFGGITGGNAHDPLSIGGFGYQQFKHTRRLMRSLNDFGANIGTATSPFLNGLYDDLRALKDSHYFKLVDGPACVTESGPVLKADKPWYRPGYKFRPTLFKPLLLAIIVLLAVGFKYASGYFLTGTMPDSLRAVYGIVGLIAIFGIIPIIYLYATLIGNMERDAFMKPTGRALFEDDITLRALDALGELELLFCHLKYKDAYPSSTALPDIIDASHHIFEAEDLRSPIIGMEDESYIGNDITFDVSRLSFITGPNSGGKTALSKSICQNQVLAQMGGYVTARSARISNALQIFYQVPQAGELSRGEGRFATELARTRDIFFHTSKDALVVLDEPFEGTSFEERLETSEQVLDGFIRLEATVLFITHNHALARLYRDKDDGDKTQFLEASFENDNPTHKFKTGIASTSHAARIANEIGFGHEDIQRRFEKEES